MGSRVTCEPILGRFGSRSAPSYVRVSFGSLLFLCFCAVMNMSTSQGSPQKSLAHLAHAMNKSLCTQFPKPGFKSPRLDRELMSRSSGAHQVDPLLQRCSGKSSISRVRVQKLRGNFQSESTPLASVQCPPHGLRHVLGSMWLPGHPKRKPGLRKKSQN